MLFCFRDLKQMSQSNSITTVEPQKGGSQITKGRQPTLQYFPPYKGYILQTSAIADSAASLPPEAARSAFASLYVFFAKYPDGHRADERGIFALKMGPRSQRGPPSVPPHPQKPPPHPERTRP
jgi:hypothetical protein